MRKVFIVLTISGLISCKNQPLNNVSEESTLFKSSIPDLMLFNSNEVLESDTLLFVKNHDTIKQYIYDSLGRLKSFKLNKAPRKEYYTYFQHTKFPIAKFINTDYSLQYFSSLVARKDTIVSYWFYGFGVIEDTLTYVFQNNRLKEFKSSPLNDHEKHKTKTTLFYKDSLLQKIITVKQRQEIGFLNEFDSIVTSYKYTGNYVSLINQTFYLKGKEANDKIFFNEKGYPIRYIEKDTIEYKISH